MSREEVNIVYADDDGYPQVMKGIPGKYDIVRVGRLDCVPLFQVINKLAEPRCRHCYLDEDKGVWHRECEEETE